MAETDCMGITPVQEKKCKIAVENTCERCRDYFTASRLELHLISRRIYREMVHDPSARILVVCQICHEDIHTLPVPVKKQRAIVGRRGFYIRRDLRRILLRILSILRRSMKSISTGVPRGRTVWAGEGQITGSWIR